VPRISAFYGIVIWMYFDERRHEGLNAGPLDPQSGSGSSVTWTFTRKGRTTCDFAFRRYPSFCIVPLVCGLRTAWTRPGFGLEISRSWPLARLTFGQARHVGPRREDRTQAS
jgi:hypothetical protein